MEREGDRNSQQTRERPEERVAGSATAVTSCAFVMRRRVGAAPGEPCRLRVRRGSGDRGGPLTAGNFLVTNAPPRDHEAAAKARTRAAGRAKPLSLGTNGRADARTSSVAGRREVMQVHVAGHPATRLKMLISWRSRQDSNL